jgi:hypothetical protein
MARKSGKQSESAIVLSASASIGAEADMPNANDVNTHNDAIAPTPTPLSLAIDNAREIEAALAIVGASSPARAVLEAALIEAQGNIALLEAEAQRQLEHDGRVAEAEDAAAKLPESLRASALAAMLAAIEADYAPEPEATPEPQSEPIGRRQASDRQHERNAAAAGDTELMARAAAVWQAFDADSAKLRCTAQRTPGTRFPSLVALAPSGAGVANAADYDALVRAVRAYMVAQGWPRTEANGATTAESKWLAARGRYAAGGTANAERSFVSGAAIAQYADGRFRLAYPGTAGVKFLRSDAGAWQAFVGTTAGAVQPTVAPTATSSAPSTPDAPTLAQTAPCQHCGAKNIVGHYAQCRACKREDWQVA